MKKLLLSISASVGLALSAPAQSASPFYQTLSDYGNAASPSETDFIAEPGLQFRLISVNYGSDTNNATLQVSTGTGAYAITATNVTSSSVTNQVNSTNGLTGGSVLLLQHGGACYIGTLSTWNESTNSGPYGGTNVVLTSGGWGVATSPGDVVYQMGTAVTVPIGAATNWLNGEAIFIGNVGKPVRVQLTPALSTNKLFSVTGHYE